MILCPEQTNIDGKEMKLHGVKGMMNTSSITFRVEKCTEDSNCKSDEEITDYIKDINFQTWIIHE